MTSLLTSCVKCFLLGILRGSEISMKSATPHNSSAMTLCSPRVKLVGPVENQARKLSKASIAPIAIRVLFFLFIQTRISSPSSIVQKKELLSMLTPGRYKDNKTNISVNSAYNTNLSFLYIVAGQYSIRDLPKY